MMCVLSHLNKDYLLTSLLTHRTNLQTLNLLMLVDNAHCSELHSSQEFCVMLCDSNANDILLVHI